MRWERGGALDQEHMAVAGLVVAAAAVLHFELRSEMAGQGQVVKREPGAEQWLFHLELDRRIVAGFACGKAGFDRLGVDDAAEADGERDELTDVWKALALIGVEHIRRCAIA